MISTKFGQRAPGTPGEDPLPPGGRPDLMLAGAVWAGMLGLLINMALVALERRAFRWHIVRTAATA